MSIGADAIAFTMQAEAGSATLDEAMASGVFDMTDEPGAIRLPVTLEVTIPHRLLHPPVLPRLDAAADPAAGMPREPDSRRAHTRFGNYSR